MKNALQELHIRREQVSSPAEDSEYKDGQIWEEASIRQQQEENTYQGSVLRIGHQLCQGIQSLAQPECQSSANGLEVTRAKPPEMYYATAALCEHHLLGQSGKAATFLNQVITKIRAGL